MGPIVLTRLEPGLVTPAASWLSASFQSDDGVNQLGISEFKVSEAEWLNLEELAAANSLVLPFVITVTYFRHANQAAGSRAFALRRIMSFAKSSRVKVHWNGAADLS